MRTLSTLATLLLGLAVVFWAPAAKAHCPHGNDPNHEHCGGGEPPPPAALCSVQPVWGNNIDDPTRFILVMNDEAICDQETGLVWEQSPSTALQPAQAGLISALFLGCYDKIVGGRKGWRWPNVQELTSLSDPIQINPALPIGHPFSNIQLGVYWAYNSNGFAYDLKDVNISKLYGVPFSDNSVQSVSTNDQHFLWCVRGGQG